MSILPGQIISLPEKVQVSVSDVPGGSVDGTRITELLQLWKSGDSEAGEKVIQRTYGELRRIARAHLRRERAGHSLGATGLLHEAYVRLLRNGPGTVESLPAFLRLMSAEMRRRLIDHARRRLAVKRAGGRLEPLTNGTVMAIPAMVPDSELALARLDRALDDLVATHPRVARVVQLRFLAGMTTEDAADELGVSAGTVKRDWTFARAWLAAAIAGDDIVP